MVVQPPVLKEVELRQSSILDANYEKVDLGKTASHWKHLTYNEQKVMLKCLQKYPQAFKGGLGTLKMKPVRLENKADAEPYHSRPFLKGDY